MDDVARPAPRIAALDVIRGAALLGILVANLPGFALPRAAYFSPLAWGGTDAADVIAWAITFVLVEGKMRGLFALLFGASLLLVIERADAAGRNAAAVHLRRMAALFAIGCAHFYLLWWGDILSHYALVGTVAALFAVASTRMLVFVGAGALAWSIIQATGLTLAAIAAAPRANAAQVADWAAFSAGFGAGDPAEIAREIAIARGAWMPGIAWRWTELASPLDSLLYQGPETLGYMLLGMAGLRTGFLTGAWPGSRYRRWALVALGITLPLHAVLAALVGAQGYDLRFVMAASLIGSPLLRPFTIAGYAALLLLLPQTSWLARRLAGAGRMALSNYLGTSLVMTAVFEGWGAGQFARWSRADLYWLVPPMWAAMLLWPGWWLRRWSMGPMEWVWRSLAGGRTTPTRVPAAPDRAC